VVGLGARPGRPVAELRAAVEAALAEAGARPEDVRALATLDRRAGESGIRALAAGHGWAVLAIPAAALAAQDVPNPAARVAAAAGTPSVAEAAALVAAGAGSGLILEKRVFPGITVAIARGAQP
jgi:cobalamin biosynthesis protein CbiG